MAYADFFGSETGLKPCEAINQAMFPTEGPCEPRKWRRRRIACCKTGSNVERLIKRMSMRSRNWGWPGWLYIHIYIYIYIFFFFINVHSAPSVGWILTNQNQNPGLNPHKLTMSDPSMLARVLAWTKTALYYTIYQGKWSSNESAYCSTHSLLSYCSTSYTILRYFNIFIYIL